MEEKVFEVILKVCDPQGLQLEHDQLLFVKAFDHIDATTKTDAKVISEFGVGYSVYAIVKVELAS